MRRDENGRGSDSKTSLIPFLLYMGTRCFCLKYAGKWINKEEEEENDDINPNEVSSLHLHRPNTTEISYIKLSTPTPTFLL